MKVFLQKLKYVSTYHLGAIVLYTKMPGISSAQHSPLMSYSLTVAHLSVDLLITL